MLIPLYCNRSCGAVCQGVTPEAVHEQARAFGWRSTGDGWMCPSCQRVRGIAVGLDELVSRVFPPTQPPSAHRGHPDTIPCPPPSIHDEETT